jgi:putative mycofactocin binding protein MftB
MEPQKHKKYRLALGTQVREEDFGLLFYTMTGPRLYFLFSGHLFDSRFFQGELPLEQWMREQTDRKPVKKSQILGLRQSLNQLKEKGVIIEC